MTKVYNSFSDFRAENKAIFKFLSKSDGRGLHEAIWDSRTPEVEDLKKQLEALKQELQREREIVLLRDQEMHALRHSLNDSNGSIDDVRQELFKAQDQAMLLRSNSKNVIEENAQLKNQIEEMMEREESWRNRFEKSVELVAQLEAHIQRQKQTNEELVSHNERLQSEKEESLREVAPLQYKVKEMQAHAQMLEIDLDQYKTFHEQGRIFIAQQDAHLEKMKSNSKVLKELAEKSKEDFKKACQELKHQAERFIELEKRMHALADEKANLIKEKTAQDLFVEELKNGIRNQKNNLDDLNGKFKGSLLEIESLKKQIETLTAAEHYRHAELTKARTELEKSRLEKEKLTSELRWLNSTIRDVQNTIGTIHKEYVKVPRLPTLDA